MTDTVTRVDPAVPGAERCDRSIPLLVGAATLVVLIVGAVVVLGVQRPPTVSRLIDQPDPAPPAGVVWTSYRGDRTCLEVARPDGQVDRPWCDRHGGELVGWTDGVVQVQTWDGRASVLAIDLQSGEVTRGPGGEVEDAGHHGWAEEVYSERRAGELVLRLVEDDTELWRVDAPERYDVHSSARSADGSWVAMVDTADRLLVVPVDGSAEPREWASGVSSWQPPLWEGTTWSSR
jgi:hypothetical protein